MGDFYSQGDLPPEIDFTKLPARTLLQTRDLPKPKEAKPWKEVELPVDILLLTVKDCEFLSCVSHLNPGYYRSSHGNLGTVYFGEMGTEGQTLKISVLKCYPGPAGPGGSSITVTNGVEELGPKAVFCVGFCGGLSQEVNLGDVVISAKLRTYSSVKVTENGIQERGLGVPLERNLLSLIKNADDGWKAPLKGSWEVKVRKDGVYLSGPEKVESEERRAELVKRFPDAIAIEMEGEGLFSAAHDLKVEWIVIKGVSNFADGRESDSWKQFASVMAASLTAHILKDPIVFEKWPHYKTCARDGRCLQQKNFREIRCWWTGRHCYLTSRNALWGGALRDTTQRTAAKETNLALSLEINKYLCYDFLTS